MKLNVIASNVHENFISTLFSPGKTVMILKTSSIVIRELKHATFLSHGRQPEVNNSHARTVVFPRFSN